jgi:hypothetical protein
VKPRAKPAKALPGGEPRDGQQRNQQREPPQNQL